MIITEIGLSFTVCIHPQAPGSWISKAFGPSVSWPIVNLEDSPASIPPKQGMALNYIIWFLPGQNVPRDWLKYW